MFGHKSASADCTITVTLIARSPHLKFHGLQMKFAQRAVCVRRYHIMCSRISNKTYFSVSRVTRVTERYMRYHCTQIHCREECFKKELYVISRFDCKYDPTGLLLRRNQGFIAFSLPDDMYAVGMFEGSRYSSYQNAHS